MSYQGALYLVVGTFSLAMAVPAKSAAQDYTAGIEAWRIDREERLKADDGWLTVNGLFFLIEGENSFGSSPTNDIVLREGPEVAGLFTLQNKRISVRATDGRTLSIDGKNVTSANLWPHEGDRLPTITIGALSMFAHYSGDRLAIRMRDKESKIRYEFRGLRWFPIDKGYRVRARYRPHDRSRVVKLPNILGDIETFTSSGSVTFTLGSQELRMMAVDSGDRLWFIFRDLTSGSETYPAARFLYADAPGDGWTVLDFNQAYNPPCAFNPHTTCPLPPPENRLPLRVEAGELNYHTTH